MEFFMCFSILLYVWINNLNHVVCYDQLVLNGKTKVESSSVYGHQSADKTIDKNKEQTYKDCMHTAEGKNEAWLKIDLGDKYNLKSVKIWYRNDRGPISTIRLQGFSIFASKNGEFDKNNICYQDPGNVELDSLIEVNCSRTAQFVKIQTNKSYGDGIFLEICEVEIFGCQRKTYGRNCEPCDFCESDCDVIGQCDKDGCLHDGYLPPYCKDCSFGRYGNKCNLTCGHCFGNTTCNQKNGYCDYNYAKNRYCEFGWKHLRPCEEECDDGTYGEYCYGRCSDHCADGLPCRKSDGVCSRGCTEGWKDPLCTTKCSPGRYGKDCKETCGHCEQGKSCDRFNGSCSGGCESGYYGERCLTKQLVKPGKTTANSSSTAYGGYARKTVDGDFTQNDYTYCMHTNAESVEAWLRIDLGKIYNIHSVTFWYRNDSEIPGHNTKRIQGFSIGLSNSTNTPDRTICYQHKGNTPLPPKIKGRCEGVAKFVWFYTKANDGTGVFLEICEVQIFGCSYQDSDGNCMACGQCNNDCNINGECDEQGCKNDSLLPPYCKDTFECKKGSYGHGCNATCGHCANSSTCDHISGACPGGICAPGWKDTGDNKCNKKCDKEQYGINCSYRCGNCSGGITCDHVTGVCDLGCKPGWRNPKCDQICNTAWYGTNCSYRCGNCSGGETCDHVTGVCDLGCKPGWRNPKCDQKCLDGQYGPSCNRSCGHCFGKGTCNHVTGICPNKKCDPGWKYTNKCDEKCDLTSYGENCTHSCGHCDKKAACNNVNGACPSEICEPGWKNLSDKRCNQKCDNGTFGLHCQFKCSGHCKEKQPCNTVNGICLGGCADGWRNSFCNEKCKEGFYGRNCSRPCGHCAKNGTCDHVTGSCPSGLCEAGWKDSKDKRCHQECEEGTFGYHCSNNCSGHCERGLSCSKTNGFCLEGCADGWTNIRCNEKCKEGFYGRNCSRPCGHCAKNGTCDHVTGSCPSGLCEAGWKDSYYKRCDQECEEGTFGYHCSNKCSGHCERGLSCTKTNGFCLEGCADGWTNIRCNETCSRGLYGRDCKEHCGHCGGNETCHHVNGSCPELCKPGYQGDKCNTECYNGTFGLLCNFTCGDGCVTVCNKINGTCDQCLYGYIGEFCNVTVAEIQGQVSTAAAAGVGVFMLILVIIVIVLAVVLARKARQKKENDIALQERRKASNNDLIENNIDESINKTENAVPIEGNAEIEYIVTDNGQKKLLIKIADLRRIISVFSMEENKKFTEEFKGIPYGEQQHIPCSVAKLQQNMPKNRYKTTFPYDHSRVVLNVSPDNDYINANYIKDVEGKRRYIATQGPRKNTVQDFWAMIWQENIRVIVMVTKLTEGSTIKCEQYWPGQGEQMTSGQFGLQLMSQKDYANYTQRDINITNKKTKAVKTVNHVQFTSWPDHGTPSPIELLVFYRHVMRFTRMYPECPLVVHCSAGIGRTGTFIALDALYKHGQKEGKIDVVEYVKIMREDRMNMIQNAGQYVFLYKALYEIFKTNGRLLNKEEFIKEVTSQLMSNKAANASQFKKEFNELLSIKPVLDENETKDARQNIDLNMTKTVLPADSIRVLLTSYARGRGNYYNAVPISSYTLRDGLIAAQYPVEGAAVDLVRLLIDQECTILVSINQLSDIASSAEWMTTSAEKSVISPYKTMLGTGRSLSNKLKMTVLKMKHDKDSEWHTVKVLEILNWKINEKIPAEEDVLIELMNKIQEIIKDPDTKIIVLSRDGATGCGIFCAVYNAIQQLQQDNEVDMFTIVRQLQMRRPEMISSMSEYQCCCQVVANFFSARKDDIYENAQGRQEVTKMEENIYANTSS